MTISSKYQVVIPKEVRERLNLKPGQKLQAFVVDGVMKVVPIGSIDELRGLAPGIDTRVPREPDRE